MSLMRLNDSNWGTNIIHKYLEKVNEIHSPVLLVCVCVCVCWGGGGGDLLQA